VRIFNFFRDHAILENIRVQSGLNKVAQSGLRGNYWEVCFEEICPEVAADIIYFE
jgi:hypothetical protein